MRLNQNLTVAKVGAWSVRLGGTVVSIRCAEQLNFILLQLWNASSTYLSLGFKRYGDSQIGNMHEGTDKLYDITYMI